MPGGARAGLCAHLWSGRGAGAGGVPYLVSLSLQDLAWALSYYTRFFVTYTPFYGVLGAVVFLNFIRYPSLALTGLWHKGLCERAPSSPLPAPGLAPYTCPGSLGLGERVCFHHGRAPWQLPQLPS